MKISVRNLRRLVRESLDNDEFSSAQSIEFDAHDIVSAMSQLARIKLELDENTYYKTKYSFSGPIYGGSGGVTLKLSFIPMSNVAQLKRR